MANDNFRFSRVIVVHNSGMKRLSLFLFFLLDLCRPYDVNRGKKTVGIRELHPDQILSATNLLHYLSLQSQDVRSLQDTLHIAGLSSLTSSESHILRQVQSIQQRLGVQIAPGKLSPCDYYIGRELINLRAGRLFGPTPDAAIPFLMVTFDTAFADNYQLVKKLLEEGIECRADQLCA